MSQRESLPMFRPFKQLDKLLKQQKAPLESVESKPSDLKKSGNPDLSDDQLFQNAMSGVKRMEPVNRIEKPCMSLKPVVSPDRQDDDAVRELRALIETGKGFRVSQTAEYIEGAGSTVHPAVLSRLHRGEFTVQDHLDLHGLSLADAQGQFHAFMKHAIQRRRRAVLIVHGRGLSSPGQPVIKRHVVKWVNSRKWRPWIVAYASARLCDGGAGATYLLLRDHTRRSKQ